VALEQLGRNSQDLSELRADLNSDHQSHLDTREAALQAQETELRGTHPNCMLIINIVRMFLNRFILYGRVLHGPLLKSLLYQLMKFSIHYGCLLSIISLFCTFFDLCSCCVHRGTMDDRNFIFSCSKLCTQDNL
jgi:hypothetical protein